MICTSFFAPFVFAADGDTLRPQKPPTGAARHFRAYFGYTTLPLARQEVPHEEYRLSAHCVAGR